MATNTSIANIALMHLGADIITDISANTANARLCLTAYAQAKDKVLRSHPWNCATLRFQLPADGDAPLYGFAYAYSLPANPFCLRVLNVETGSYPWQVEGRKILTDMPAPLRGQYIARISEELFDAELAQALALELAATIAYRLTGSRSAADTMRQQADGALRDARSVDAFEASPPEAEDSEIYWVRF